MLLITRSFNLSFYPKKQYIKIKFFDYLAIIVADIVTRRVASSSKIAFARSAKANTATRIIAISRATAGRTMTFIASW